MVWLVLWLFDLNESKGTMFSDFVTDWSHVLVVAFRCHGLLVNVVTCILSY